MSHRVCPWYMGYFLVAPWRRLFSNPEKILAPYVKEGMTVLDVGSGMGFFSLPLARLVGKRGKVISVDIQPEMLRGLIKRAERAGLSGNIETRVCGKESLGLDGLEGRIDFALLFAVVHEVPDRMRLFSEVRGAMKHGALGLLAEPSGHVPKNEFAQTLAVAEGQGFEVISKPKVRMSHTALLRTKVE